MATTVLDAGRSREGLHLYSHCLRGRPGGVAILAINNSETTDSAIELSASSERYTLEAESLQSDRVKLNGKPLQLEANDELPSLTDVSEPSGWVNFAPATITFLAVPTAANPQCRAR